MLWMTSGFGTRRRNSVASTDFSRCRHIADENKTLAPAQTPCRLGGSVLVFRQQRGTIR